MSYFHLGEEAHVEMEVTYHSVALSYPYVSATEMKSVACTALAFDDRAYFRAHDGVMYVHWTTEHPVAAA